MCRIAKRRAVCQECGGDKGFELSYEKCAEVVPQGAADAEWLSCRRRGESVDGREIKAGTCNRCNTAPLGLAGPEEQEVKSPIFDLDRMARVIEQQLDRMDARLTKAARIQSWLAETPLFLGDTSPPLPWR